MISTAHVPNVFLVVSMRNYHVQVIIHHSRDGMPGIQTYREYLNYISVDILTSSTGIENR